MKQEFSNAWKSSGQTRKQRKYRANAPLHIKGKLLGTHLSKELRKKYGTRAVRIKKGDEVKIMVGKFKGKSGKITKVDVQRGRVAIDGMQNKKKDGTKINVYFNNSNLVITNLNTDDKRRFKENKIVTEKKDSSHKVSKLEENSKASKETK